jgi:hypothetical protein
LYHSATKDDSVFGSAEHSSRLKFTQFLIGRPTASGFDQNQQLALAFSHVIHGGLEFYAAA